MANEAPKLINLALQGGGSHGAFTWGVLDRLFEHGGLEIEGISGTSAGAMNAAVVAYGLARGGQEGARETLRIFWTKIGEAAKLSPIQPSPIDRWFSVGNMDYSPSWYVFDNLSRVFSPYQLNPLNINPLEDVLQDVIDFDWLAQQCCDKVVKLFLCASNVKTGKIKVFKDSEISAKAVLASACLPYVFQTVEVDGEFYWDGGFMGNPPIFPLIYGAESQDVLIVQINPINTDEVPTSAQDIFDRINTLSFNSSLMREMRAIAFVTRLLDEGHLDRQHYKRLNVHNVEAEREFTELGTSSKLNADPKFLDWLFQLGRERADRWLDRHYGKVGVTSSTDLQAFL
ncbi:MAG: patatin-like phospholipase family protein [Pseudomonadota bacterium]